MSTRQKSSLAHMIIAIVTVGTFFGINKYLQCNPNSLTENKKNAQINENIPPYFDLEKAMLPKNRTLYLNKENIVLDKNIYIKTALRRVVSFQYHIFCIGGVSLEFLKIAARLDAKPVKVEYSKYHKEIRVGLKLFKSVENPPPYLEIEYKGNFFEIILEDNKNALSRHDKYKVSINSIENPTMNLKIISELEPFEFD